VRQSIEGTPAEVIIIDLHNGNEVTRRPITADSAIMHWSKKIIALKAKQRTIQIFDLDAKAKLKATEMKENIDFWKWINESTLGIVTDTSVYHWNIFDASQPEPVKVFDRNTNLQVSQIHGGSVTCD
jgi:clathrin heavy chain